MAFEQTQILLTAPAAASGLVSKQFYAVTLDTAGNLALAAAAKNADGILQDKPVAGEAGVAAIFGVSKAAISANQNIAVGDLLEVDTGGTLKKAASGTVVAKALEATNVSAVAVIAVLILKSNAAYS